MIRQQFKVLLVEGKAQKNYSVSFAYQTSRFGSVNAFAIGFNL